MGYACPVCETPQADAGHLANHLAITAIARGGDHEAWLDEHVPDWADRDEAGLADAVVDHAPEAEYPTVFEDATDGAGEESAVDTEAMARLAAERGDELDAETAEVVERARELTPRRREDSETE
jgi:hypothetical protein